MSEFLHNAMWFLIGATAAVWLIVAAVLCAVEALFLHVMTAARALRSLTWPWLVIKHWREVAQ